MPAQAVCVSEWGQPAVIPVSVVLLDLKLVVVVVLLLLLLM